MPQQDQSSKIGSSPAPVSNRVIQNNKDVQQPYSSPQAAIADRHTKSPVKP